MQIHFYCPIEEKYSINAKTLENTRCDNPFSSLSRERYSTLNFSVILIFTIETHFLKTVYQSESARLHVVFESFFSDIKLAKCLHKDNQFLHQTDKIVLLKVFAI